MWRYDIRCDIMNFIATHPSIAKFKLSSASIKCCLTRHSDYIREMVNQKYKCALIYPEPDWTHALKLTSERKKLVEFIGFNFNRELRRFKAMLLYQTQWLEGLPTWPIKINWVNSIERKFATSYELIMIVLSWLVENVR